MNHGDNSRLECVTDALPNGAKSTFNTRSLLSLSSLSFFRSCSSSLPHVLHSESRRCVELEVALTTLLCKCLGVLTRSRTRSFKASGILPHFTTIPVPTLASSNISTFGLLSPLSSSPLWYVLSLGCLLNVTDSGWTDHECLVCYTTASRPHSLSPALPSHLPFSKGYQATFSFI